MKQEVRDAFWRGDVSKAIKGARAQAAKARHVGNALSAHSIMLSAHYSVWGQRNVLMKLWSFVCMLYHAHELSKNWAVLSHNQLNVLTQFYIRLCRFFNIDLSWLTAMADREISRARISGEWYEQALAHLSKAQVFKIHYQRDKTDFFVRSMVLQCIWDAVVLGGHLKKEAPESQGQRQFVRVFKKVGEILMDIDSERAKKYLLEARELAVGSANTPDQVQKIDALLAKF